MGWVPLGDLKNAVRELMQCEQAAQQKMPAEQNIGSRSRAAGEKK